MSGSHNPKTCCDRECARINGCAIGGIECVSCGKFFCSDEINEEGYCDDCEAERHKGEEMCDVCGEWKPEEEVIDGCCKECLEEN